MPGCVLDAPLPAAACWPAFALTTFASFVVAITAGGSSDDTRHLTQALSARTAIGAVDSDTRGERRFRGDDADGHDERSSALDGARR